MRCELYAKSAALGLDVKSTFINALNLAVSLRKIKRFSEMKSFLRKQLPRARRALGAEDHVGLDLRRNYAASLCLAGGASRNDVVEAVKILEELSSKARRVLGLVRPFTEDIQNFLEIAQERSSRRSDKFTQQHLAENYGPHAPGTKTGASAASAPRLLCTAFSTNSTLSASTASATAVGFASVGGSFAAMWARILVLKT